MKHNKMDRAEAYSTGKQESDWSEKYANDDLTSGDIQVIPYLAKSYLCQGGGRLVHKDMVRRGMPTDFTGWLFVTLTLDRELCDHDPEAGYLAGKDRMRRFFEYLANNNHKIDRWIWKLEFHPDSPDWTHWHLLLDTRRFIPWEIIKRAWNLGGVDVERIENFAHGEAIGKYEFKYVFKEGMAPPKWLLKYKRIRFIQTRGIFNKKEADSPKEERVEEKLNRLEDDYQWGVDNRSESPTIGQRLKGWGRKITAIFDTQDGKQVRAYDLTISTESFFGHLWNLPHTLRSLMAPFHATVQKHQIILDYVAAKITIPASIQGATRQILRSA